MKKFLSIMLTTILVFSMSTMAFAEESDATTKTMGSKATTYDAVIKAYTVEGATDVGTEGDAGYVDGSALYPAETLEFVSAADKSNPDGGVANLTIENLAVNGNSEQHLQINVPEFSKVGTYHFTISESAGKTEGVTYTTDEIAVSVLVTYDYNDTDSDGYLMTATVGITLNGDSKSDTFTNAYGVGSLAVTKTVTGNLGDTEKEFEVDVTFTAAEDKEVKSDITYVDGVEIKTITAKDMADGSETVTITVKHGETVDFYNIPDGVTYTVEEHNYTDGEKNGGNGYDAPQYSWSDSEKKIATLDNDAVTITNNKGTTVDTGITLDNIPYMMMLAIAAAGLALFTAKKRRYTED